MEIEIGDYVRTINGYIYKLLGEQQYLDNTGETVDFIEDIVKHSKNLIDLVEVGDYVNGKKIEDILEPSIKIEYVAEKILCFETDYPIEKGLRCYHNCDIKSIVTHEQFASIEYKVEEDK